MEVEKLQGYIDSVAELEQAYAKVREMGAIIDQVGKYLGNYPYKMTVSNVKVSFPVTGDREYTLNADQWPSAIQIAESIADYMNKRLNVQRLYLSLSDAQKKTVKAPPNI